MTRKTLIDILFPSKVGLVLPSKEIIGRIEELKEGEINYLNSKTFIEYVISGKEKKEHMYNFNSYIENNFQETTNPTAGDIVIIRNGQNPYEISFEGIITKQEGREREVMYKSGTGPFSWIEIESLKQIKQGYERKGTYVEYYRPNKEIFSQNVKEVEVYTPNKDIRKYLPATVKVNVA